MRVSGTVSGSKNQEATTQTNPRVRWSLVFGFVGTLCAVITVAVMLNNEARKQVEKEQERLEEIRAEDVRVRKEHFSAWNEKQELFVRPLQVSAFINRQHDTARVRITSQEFFQVCSKCYVHFGEDMEVLCVELKEAYEKLEKTFDRTYQREDNLLYRIRQYETVVSKMNQMKQLMLRQIQGT